MIFLRLGGVPYSLMRCDLGKLHKQLLLQRDFERAASVWFVLRSLEPCGKKAGKSGGQSSRES